MRQNRRGVDPIGRIFDEQLPDQILGIVADLVPVLLREHQLPRFDGLEERALALGAVASALPVAGLPIAASGGEWQVAAEEDVGDDTEGPEVALFVVGQFVVVRL